MELTERDREILEFERSWWTVDVPKDQQIQEKFQLSITRYHQILIELLDMPAAAIYDPLVIRRLQRQRDRRRQARLDTVSEEQPSSTGSTGEEI
ncbi:MAG TPA: DUF3263 domain-containing protein [Acidimicrobiales bacterium]|nr:DUF3263 domain-containing protein [Acidimicrobiales bacterium]